MAKVWVVDMDVEVDSQDFIIESDLPPPVGAITRTESTYSVQSESGRGATRASQRNNPHNNRDQREPSRLRTMSNAAARFFGVAEDQPPEMLLSFHERRDIEDGTHTGMLSETMGTIRSLGGTLARGAQSLRNATSRGGSANGPRGGPDSSVSFYDLTPPPSYPVPQRPSGSYRADVVDERMRKDEIYARQLRQGSVDYIAEGSQEGRRSSQDRLRTGTFNSAVINDPAVRAQIEAMVPYRPYFMIIVTVIQVAYLAYALYQNNALTGTVIQLTPAINPMIGPTADTLIAVGANFQPCMFPAPYVNPTTCPSGSTTRNPPVIVTLDNSTTPSILCGDLQTYCQLSAFNKPGVPDQWYRAIVAMFLHAGFVHFIFNMVFQLRTGFAIERDIGFLRVFFIYFISGIGGFFFSAVFSPMNPALGCSGALFGLVACLWMDLFQKWKMLNRPWVHFTKLFVITILALAVGLLPYMDNFAHIGGFILGLFCGIIFIPAINLGPHDRRRKIFLIILSIPCIIAIYFGLLYALVNGIDGRVICPNCMYIDCIPSLGWCGP